MQVRWVWALWVAAGLTACEPESRKPAQLPAPETRHFETQVIRREVDHYKEAPSPASHRKMELAFAAFDDKLRDMQARAAMLAGEEKARLEAQIANLKHRRDLHWTRAQTALAQLEPIEKAQPAVAERSSRAVPSRPAEPRQPARAYRQRRVYRPMPQREPGLFQRLGRIFRPF